MTPTRLLMLSALAFSTGAVEPACAQQDQTQEDNPWREAGRATQRRTGTGIIRVVRDSQRRSAQVTPTGAPGTGDTLPPGETTGTLEGGVTPIGSPNLAMPTGPRLSTRIAPPPSERRVGAARFSLRGNLRTPTDFLLVLRNGNEVNLSWTDTTTSESAFVVQRAERVGDSWGSPVELRVNANTTGIVDTPETGEYAYRVAASGANGRSWFSEWEIVAVNSGPRQSAGPGNTGNPGNTGSGNTTPPTPPVISSVPDGLAAQDTGARTVSLSWSPSTGGELRAYEVERSPAFPSGLVRTGPNTTTLTDASGVGLFSYRVRSVSRAGASDFSAWIPVTVQDIIPIAPTGLAAVDLGDHDRVRLTWTDTSDNELFFTIERETLSPSEQWQSPHRITVSANSTEQIDSPGAGTHRYRVTASNRRGTSEPMGWVTVHVTPPAVDTPPTDVATVPTPPGGLVVSDAGSRRAEVRWTDTSTNETAFEIERVPAFSQGRVRVSANQTVHSDGGVAGERSYRVRAVNANGASAFSDWVTVTIAEVAPAAPSGLSVASAGDHASVTLSWNDNADNETSFRVEQQTFSGGSWGATRSFTTLANVESQTDVPGPGEHRYRIAAINSAGVSSFTPWTGVTVGTPPVDPNSVPPAAPHSLGVSDLQNRRAGLVWTDASENEAGFQVERQPAFATGQVTLGANVDAYVDDCGAGTFNYRVRAYNSAGYSAWSAWSGVTVRETPPTPPSNLSVMDAGDTRHVQVRWNDNAFNEQGYRLERMTWNGSQWGSPLTVLLNNDVSSYVDDAGLGRFRYRVQAFNAGGDSSWTDWSSIGVTDGWTPVVASPDTRVIYVSSSQGNDANDGLSEATPKRTIFAGYQLLRAGYPDHLRLRRGDVWVDQHIGDMMGTTVMTFNKRGRSASEPMVVYTYGDSPERPKIKLGTKPYGVHFQSGGGISYVSIIGIAFEANRKNPNSPDYVPGATGQQGISSYCAGSDILIEDCKFEYMAGCIGLQGIDQTPTGRLRNVTLRRCVLVDAYSTTSHSQGIFTADVDNMLIEENVFDHNGWHPTVFDAESTIYNHNMYLSRTCTNFIVRNNISARASATGIQLRGNPMHAINNLVLKCPLGVTIGHDELNYPTQFCSGSIAYNVILDSNDIGLGNHNGQRMPRGFGVTWGKASHASIINNVIAHNTTAQSSEPAVFTDRPHDNVLFEGNVVYNWVGATGTATLFQSNIVMPGSTTMRGNRFVQPAGSRIVRLMQATPGGSWQNNRYYSSLPSADSWFLASNAPISSAEWIARSQEINPQLGQVNMPDPNRTVASYMQSLQMTPTLEAFLQEARQQSRTRWRPEFTAQAVNAFIREGYGVPEPSSQQLAGN